MYAGFLTQKVNGKHRGSVYLKYKAGQERVIQMEDGGPIEHQKWRWKQPEQHLCDNAKTVRDKPGFYNV